MKSSSTGDSSVTVLTEIINVYFSAARLLGAQTTSHKTPRPQNVLKVGSDFSRFYHSWHPHITETFLDKSKAQRGDQVSRPYLWFENFIATDLEFSYFDRKHKNIIKYYLNIYTSASAWYLHVYRNIFDFCPTVKVTMRHSLISTEAGLSFVTIVPSELWIQPSENAVSELSEPLNVVNMQCVCGNVAMYDLRWAERWAPDWNKREVIMCDVATCHVSLPPDTCICCPVTDTHNHRPSIRAVAVIVYYEVGISSEC